jgi:ubiquinone/menaquinone biosynthesis C-methylase UbiE
LNHGKDLFSSQSKEYAAFRPTYPKALYQFIFNHVKGRKSAWDCGCGNGQVANDLSSVFEKVLATDISTNQLQSAVRASNIIYSVSPAEQTSFADSSFDLITVGQALHWFDLPKFYEEVKRVGNPGALLAVWGYSLLHITPEIDKVVQYFNTHVVGPYWDKERRLVDERYQTISFPFEEIPTPPFEFSFRWSKDRFLGYISSWSSVQKYKREKKEDPIDRLSSELSSLWRGEEQVTFPLFLRLGKVHSAIVGERTRVMD